MDIDSEIDRIASKYHCDSSDPNFAILEAVIRKGDQILEAIPNGSKADLLKQDWNQFVDALRLHGEGLGKTVVSFSEQLSRAEELGKKVAQNLLASKLLRMRDRVTSGLVGMTGPLIILVAGAVWYTTFSLPAQLSNANLHLSIESSSKGSRLTLRGPRVISAAQGGQSVVVEFDR